MTYHPEYEIDKKSPGVWKEVRRLEDENARLREEFDHYKREDYAAQIQALREESAAWVKEFNESNDKLRKQRDTLLAALTKWARSYDAHEEAVFRDVGLRAAIFKIEGEK